MAHNPLGRLRLSTYALPLAVIGAVLLMFINEAGYRHALGAQYSAAARSDAQAELQALQGRLLDAETAQRGYLLSGREPYLEPYHAALLSLPGSLRELGAFYSSDPLRREPIQRIERAAEAKLSELALTLRLQREGKHEQWQQLMLSDIGREQMDELRRSVAQLRLLEDESIRGNREALVGALRFSRIGIHVMALLALLALVLMLRKARALDQGRTEHAQALAAERDRLEQQVSRRTADLTELARHLQTAREDERARVARDLHDELGALLTATKLDAARLKRTLGSVSPATDERLRRLNATVDQGIAMKRRIIEDLRPSSLDNLGLKAALEIQAREFAQRADLVVRCELEPVRLSQRAQITTYRLVQESLTNVAKYAKAREVVIRLVQQGEQVRVSVRDDGIGFDPHATRSQAHGLLGMRYRIEAEGGSMKVVSAPGAGTQIEAVLPVASETATDPAHEQQA